MKKVVILGTGSFGTAMAVCLSQSPLEVVLWGNNIDILNEIQNQRTNQRYLSDIVVPENIQVEKKLDLALKEADFVLFIVPSQAIRSLAKKVAPLLSKHAIIVNFAKGLELGTHMRLTNVLKEEIMDHPITVLSGPSHAEEVAKMYPTSVVLAADEMEISKLIQEQLSTPYFRIYRSNDVAGVEMSGVVKNIIAVAAGISDGLGYHDNTKALLITRGLVEMVRLGEAMGASRETFQGLAGLGDLVVTATSTLSRNWTFGNKIGEGKTVEQALSEMSMVVEGLVATKVAYELAQELNIDMPITERVYNILYNHEDPKKSVSQLMSRDKKADGYY